MNLDDFILRGEEDSESWSAKTKNLFKLHREISVKNVEIIDLVQSNVETILTRNRGLHRLREIERDREVDDTDYHKRRLTTKIEGGVIHQEIFTDGTMISDYILRNAYQIYGGGIFFYNECELNASIVFQKDIKSLFEAEIGAAVIALH